ncbi:MAG: tetratricopeptide repeat protein [Flavobacteriales bacterium]|nr:tetratricopeptide repeat protein [Flavobacteriales bacterium]
MIKKLLPCLFALGTIALFAQEEQSELMAGMTALRMADHGTAEKAFTAAIGNAPDNARTWYYRAVNRLAVDDPQGALRDLDRALELDPTDVHGMLRRAEANERLGLMAAARKDLKQVLLVHQNGPAAEHALSQLGYHALAEGDARRALQYADKLCSIAPYDAAAHYEKGTALSLLDRDQEALGAFRRALELDPTMDKAMAGEGIILMRMGLRQDACFSLYAAREAGNRSVDELLMIHCE